MERCVGCGIELGTQEESDRGAVGGTVADRDEEGPLCLLCAKEQSEWAGSAAIVGRASDVLGRCKGCGYEIDPSEDYCSECLCEEDGL